MSKGRTRFKSYERFNDTVTYCANCSNAKIEKETHIVASIPVLVARCDKGLWRRRDGKKQSCTFVTIREKAIASCLFYESMGDENLRDYLDSLPQNMSDYILLQGGANCLSR